MRFRSVKFATLSVVLLALSLVVAQCAKGSSYNGSPAPSPTPTPTPGVTADVTISIQGMSYSPNPANVKVGQTVAWRNDDSVPHTATGNAGEFNTNTIGPGSTSSPIMMNKAGSIPYHCTIHGLQMSATLIVQ